MEDEAVFRALADLKIALEGGIGMATDSNLRYSPQRKETTVVPLQHLSYKLTVRAREIGSRLTSFAAPRRQLKRKTLGVLTTTFRPQESVVILGSSRSDGNTSRAVDAALTHTHIEIVDLGTCDIGHYDYQHQNQTDAFLPLIERLSDRRFWILATPIYWYTMSAQMKIFVDRLTDLITIRKDLGRMLHGKSLAVIASGSDPGAPEGFESPFRLTCEYLGMSYIGSHYVQMEDDMAPEQLRSRVGRLAWIAECPA
jgi:putative NADPH-quinone reductase